MRWYVKLLKEDDSNIFIAYSYESNRSCDGVLRYNKDRRNIEIENLSEGANKFATEMVFENIHRLLRKGGRIPDERKCICIG